jgi:hypothetical protein
MPEIFSGDTDPILLMIDNTSYCLAHVLKLVRNTLELSETDFATLMKYHISFNSPKHLREYGDFVQARELEKGLRHVRSFTNTDPELFKAYWLGVARYYRQKHEEGNRMEEFLDLHYAKTGEKK